MSDDALHRSHALELWGRLVELGYDRRERRPREILGMIDAVGDSLRSLRQAGQDLEVIGYLEEYRNEAVRALVDKLIERSEDRIDRAKTAKQKLARIEAATAEFKALNQEFGESNGIAQELANLHDQWLEAGFYTLLDSVDPLLRRGRIQDALEVCEKAHTFALSQSYRHESDRKLHTDEVEATVAQVNSLESDPRKLKRFMSRKPRKLEQNPPPTENQKAYAHALGIQFDETISAAALSELISARVLEGRK